MAKRKSRKKITFGRALAAGGRVSTTIGVIFSYIGCAIMCIIAIYLMGLGIVGKYPLFESGYCTQDPPPMCGSTKETCTGRGCSWDEDSKTCMVTDSCSGIMEDSCKKTSGCNWSSPLYFTTETRILYICGGILLIGLGIGTVYLSIWFSHQAQKSENFAAFAGGAAAVNILGDAFSR